MQASNPIVHIYPAVPVTPSARFEFPRAEGFPLDNQLVFKGREELLEALHKRCHSPDLSISVLSGLTGSGTSAIAIRYLFCHRAEYRHCFYFDARNPDALHAQFRELAGGAGLDLFYSPSTMSDEELRHHVKTWIEGLPSCLVIYDNAPTQAVLADFLPSIGNAKVIVASHQNAWQEKWLLPVPEFSPEEAKRLGAETEALTHRSGRLPVALLQYVHYFKTTLSENAPLRRIFKKAMPSGHPQENTWNKMKAVLDQQSGMGKEILKCLAKSADVTTAELKEIMELPSGDPKRLKAFGDAWAQLQQYYLVTVNAEGKIEMPPALVHLLLECGEDLLESSSIPCSSAAHSVDESKDMDLVVHYSLMELSRQRLSERAPAIRSEGDLVYRQGSVLGMTTTPAALPEMAEAIPAVASAIAAAGISPPVSARVLQAGGSLTFYESSWVEVTVESGEAASPVAK